MGYIKGILMKICMALWNIIKSYIGLYALVAITLLSGCNSIPGLFQAVDDIATDNALEITFSRESLQKETDIDVYIKIQNKDLP